ncbi:MAG: glycosyltransferase family 2 protein [Alphaproteobacteria bacterium]|nr:glycosyltransferase family 2 protein [Alphaproteobacteria bacterium]
MTETPLITIGITCFNAAQSIEKAIISAQKQDWSNTEIVVVDDASTDKSPEILAKLAQNYPKLNVYNLSQNVGVGGARRKIIDEAKGEFVVFFDDDDESTNDRVSKQYQRIVEYEAQHSTDLVICHANRVQTYADGAQRIEVTVGTEQDNVPNGLAMADRILFGKPTPNGFGSTATCSQMARTAFYKKLGSFDPDFRRMEDTDLNARAAIVGAHFVGIKEPLVNQHMTLTSDKAIKVEQESLLKLLEKHKSYIETRTSYDFCRKWTELKYQYLSGKKIAFMFELLKLLLRHPILTVQRLIWAIPARSLNKATTTFYKGPHD